MRVGVGILLLVFSIAPAAAQYAAPAPAPVASPPAAATPAPASPAAATPPAAASGSTIASAPAAPAAPIYPPGSADFHVNGADTMAAAPLRSPEQQKADEQSQAAWQARCRPTVVEDRDGVRRARYAAVDCDLSPFNTVGGK
jgi:hypothetical protein